MKKGLIVLMAATLSLLFASCNKWNDCSKEEANNYGRPTRLPRLYSSTYMLLSDFTTDYWQLVDGDTLRLEVYLHQYHRQDGSDADGYYLSLYGTPQNSVQNAKDSRPSSDYIYGEKKILVSPKVVGDPYVYKNIKRMTPYIPEEYYDTIKNRICKVEGVIYFPHFEDVQFCREVCYLHIPDTDWDEQINHILNQ